MHGLLRFDLLLDDSSIDHFRRLAAAFVKQAQMHRSRLVLQRQTWQERAAQKLPELIANPRVDAG
ncbi:hypothetical protein D3C81_1977380 [compost metagenome]